MEQDLDEVLAEEDKVHTGQDLDYTSRPVRKEMEALLEKLRAEGYVDDWSFDDSPTSAVFKCILTLDGSTVKQNSYTNLMIIQEFRSPLCNSKKLAKAYIAIEFLSLFPEQQQNLARWKKLYHSPDPSLSPIDVLYRLTSNAKNNYSYRYEIRGEGSNKHFWGCLKIGKDAEDARELTVTVPYIKDHRYCRNKLAVQVLEDASFYRKDIWESYKEIQKSNLFISGRIFAKEEGGRVEFKGHKDPMGSMNPKSVKELFHEIGEQVCGFLNAEGGSIYIGIHDSGTIQGIELSVEEKDQLMLQVHSSVTNRLEPYSEQHLKFEFHMVKYFDPRTGTTEPFARPDPSLLDKYHFHLEERVESLVKHIESSPRPKTSRNRNLFVLEVRTRKSQELVFFDGKAYIRDHNMKKSMTVAEIKARIIQQYEAKKTPQDPQNPQDPH
ncbi:hypothetical protein BV898_06010 [Hypsibius exemplaris]|uniref:Schlafen AlbA-2 domain-containing protein n=1 Tax=Hypsibius exemplaris TaxID=2072580 RepID=A0A1W0WXU8_HYPEX|nr:hypothetical protein BV898_06010 [Hypsibius exemplaris]